MHAQRLSVSLHALSLDDAGFTLIATAPRAFVRRDFVHRVRRDLAGALSPSEAGPPLRFGPAQVEPLRTADDHLEAYVDLMVSDPYCITPFTREGGGGVPWRRWPA